MDATQQPLRFRPAGTEDLQQLSALEQRCFSMPWSLSMLESELDNIDSSFWVADREGVIIGYIATRAILDEVHIMTLAVAPEYRRRGLAKELVSRALGYAMASDAVAASLEVRQSNVAAQQLYADFGFATIGRRKNYYQNPTEDALVMAVWLRVDAEGEDA